MSKLKAVIQYECFTSFKYIWIFYAIQYAIVALISLIIGICMGSFEEVGTNGLEINTLIYVGILGVLGFREDFKMLIQNGFTRKYIFAATFSMFCFMSGIMAFVDAVMGNLFHYINNGCFSVYGGLYGYGNLIMNWVWLFLLYIVVCSLFFVIVLWINLAGKTLSIYSGIILGGLILLIIALFQYVISGNTANKIFRFLMEVMGFMADGSTNALFPVIAFLFLGIFLGGVSYTIIRKTELK